VRVECKEEKKGGQMRGSLDATIGCTASRRARRGRLGCQRCRAKIWKSVIGLVVRGVIFFFWCGVVSVEHEVGSGRGCSGGVGVGHGGLLGPRYWCIA